MKTALFSYLGEITLPDRCVEDCSQSGSNDDAVKYWATQLDLALPVEKLKKELKGYGAWNDEELSNHLDNIERIIWIAAHDIKENYALEDLVHFSELQAEIQAQLIAQGIDPLDDDTLYTIDGEVF